MADAALAPSPVALRRSPPARRWSLRGSPDDLAPIRLAWGPLPDTMLATARDGGRAALRLGPDEWLLLAESDVPGLARAEGLFSLVDVSDRQVGLELVGEAVPEVLNAGCPLDLRRAFPVGSATRTVLAKAEIVLWRVEESRWRVEVWRSFAPYVEAFLRQAVADL